MKKAIFILISVQLGSIYSSYAQEFDIRYPEIRDQEKTDLFFGRKVTDNFPVLSELEKKSVKDWYEAQDSITEFYFKENPLMENYLERFSGLQNIQKERINMIRLNEIGNYFYLKYDDSIGIEKLYYRKDLGSPETLLLDPSSLPVPIENITYLNPSFDGQKIAIGYKSNEEDFASQIVFLNIKSKKILEDKITNINPDFGGIEWLPDSSGFIYLYFPIVDSNLPGYKKNSFSVIHFLGNNPEERNMIFGNNNNISIPQDFYPKVRIGSSLDQYLIGYAATSNDFYNGYIISLTDILDSKLNWRPFFKEEHKVFFTEGRIRNDEFIFRQGNDNGNKISKIKLQEPDFNNPQVLALGTQENPITQMAVSRDKVYFSRSRFGVEVSVLSIEKDNEIRELDTPFQAGYISFLGASVAHNFVGAELDGWTSDYTRYIINVDGVFIPEGLNVDVNYPGFDKLVSRQIMVKSHDGEEVPLSLVFNEDVEFDGNREVFVYVYGAYGESLSPFFYPIFLDWALQGGVLAFPHVRGGGEKGKDWHTHGMKNLKYNSWKDLIACTEELISMGVSRKGLISLFTSSAGGITAGMAVNERPELYASFIAEVPRLHPFGLEAASTASSTSYLEYGSVKDSLEVEGLIKMDPYLNIKPKQAYPATLIMPSYNDDRIPLWDSGKYVAKLQKSNKGNTPILMDIDYMTGHGSSNVYDETVKLYSKIFSFAKTNMQ